MDSPDSPVYKKIKSELSSDEETEFYKGWKNADVVLIVEDKSLHVHSQVLSIASPVFERMFQSKFKEGRTKQVDMKEKKKKDVMNMLKMLYPSMEIKLGLYMLGYDNIECSINFFRD